MILSWRPFERMETLRHQLDQIFDERMDITDAMSEQNAAWYPAIELIDTPDNLLLHAQLPGIDRNSIDVQVTRDKVMIAGERPYPQNLDKQNYIHAEFAYGKFRRIIALPVAVENDQTQAEFQDGLLTLTLPKVEQARRRVVKVHLGELGDSAATATLEAASETIANGNNHQS